MSNPMVIRSLFRDYNVHFVGDFAPSLKELIDQSAFFVIDPNVWELYADRMGKMIPNERRLIVEANEESKSLETCQTIIRTLVDRQVRRNDRLVAIGGGIIQDVTAFSASILYRGVEWIYFPTTLLAQADSCIGSKTSINLGDKKNLIGNFYPPSEIYIDTAFLETLLVDDIKSGIGEILHYYVYAASPLFDELIADYSTVLRNRTLLEKHIRESLEIKKSLIETDEFDRGERNKFNYGHTFGHAIESVTDYAVKHGQAVAIGMDLANYASMKMGFMKSEIFHDLHERLSINFPEYDWRTIDLNRYFELLTKDKKNIGSNIGCILAKGPGMLFKEQIPLDDHFRKMIKTYFSRQALTEKA
jgi:3-dehydroquinate synthase